MPTSSRSRYPHAFSRSPIGWTSPGSARSRNPRSPVHPVTIQSQSLAMPHSSKPPPVPARNPREPTLSSLVSSGANLQIACRLCSRHKLYGPLEAIARYGGDIRFSELQMIIRGRCRALGCEAETGAGQSVRPVTAL